MSSNPTINSVWQPPSPRRDPSKARLPSRRFATLTLVAVTGTLFSLLVFMLFRQTDRNRIEQRLQLETNDLVWSINRTLELSAQNLESVAKLCGFAGDISRVEFRRFVERYLRPGSGIQAIEWAPRVTHDERAAYEQAARLDGLTDFQITEIGPDGRPQPAAPRDEYFPVYLLEPLAGNEPALGFDLASDPTRDAVLHRARDTGKLQATGALRLLQERGAQKGMLLFWPVYRQGALTDTVTNRREHISGFVLSVFRIGSLLETSLAGLRSHAMEFCILDSSTPPSERALYCRLAGGRQPDAATDMGLFAASLRKGWHRQATVELAGRRWIILLKPTRAYFTARRSLAPWFVLLVGFGLTGLLVLYLEQRQRADAALAQSEESYRYLVENMTDGLGVQDAEGRLNYVNQRFCEMFGYAREEMLGLSVRGLVAEDELQEFEKQMAKRRAGLLEPYQATFKKKNGERFIAQVSPQTLIGDPGNWQGGFALLRDVTRRVRNEAALEEAQARYRLLVENMNEGLSLTGEEGVYTYVNPALCLMSGYAREELLGRRPLDFLDEEGRKQVTEQTTGNGIDPSGTYEVDLHRKDGEAVTVRISTQALFDAQGVWQGMLSLFADITKQKRMEKNLRKANEDLRAILDAHPDLFFRCAADGTVLDFRVGPGAELSLPAQEFIGKPGFALLRPPADEIVRQAIGHVNSTQSPVTVEYPRAGVRGDRTAEARLSPLPNGEILAVVRDITERKRTEQQLSSLSTRLLRAQDEERKRLARDLHDEFGQSLAVAKFAAHRLRSKIPDDRSDLQDMTAQLAADIEFAIRTVRTIQGGLYPIVLDHLGLIPAVEALVANFEGRTDIACTLDIEARQPEIEPERQLHLYRILQEALTNVARHANATELEVSMRKDGVNLELGIRDNGRGISPQEARGAGSLGVLGMRQRAEQCGGSFHIEGGTGGTKIVVRVPLAPASGETTDLRAPGEQPSPAVKREADDWSENI